MSRALNAQIRSASQSRQLRCSSVSVCGAGVGEGIGVGTGGCGCSIGAGVGVGGVGVLSSTKSEQDVRINIDIGIIRLVSISRGLLFLAWIIVCDWIFMICKVSFVESELGSGAIRPDMAVSEKNWGNQEVGNALIFAGFFGCRVTTGSQLVGRRLGSSCQVRWRWIYRSQDQEKSQLANLKR